MNRLQKELTDILEVYINVCERLRLTYFLANGSALGAEKYGGFIPWDDDIDVAMPREDYEVFCSKADEYLPDHLFLQNYRTEPKFPFLYSKLRNIKTTYIESGVKHLDIHHGIYIDIFPLDGYPDGKMAQHILNFKLKVLSSMQFCGFNNDVNLTKRILRILGFHKRTHKTLLRMEKTIRKFGQNTAKVCDYGDRQGKGCVPREYYAEGRTVSFEHLSVAVPEMTDEYLSYKYGDWKAELPKEQQKSHHIAVVCDLDMAYEKYKDKL